MRFSQARLQTYANDLSQAVYALSHEQRNRMSITGLQSGAFQAKLAEMRQKIADSQAKGLAKIDAAVTQGAADLDAAAEGAAAKAKSEIADALQEFGLTTNGGPVDESPKPSYPTYP